MIVYNLIILIIVVLCISRNSLSKKLNKFIYILLCALLIFIVGGRNISVGNDSFEYNRIFLETAKLSFGDLIVDTGRYEKGFLLYTKVISLFSTNYHFFFFITALISMTPIFIFVYKYSDNAYFSLLIFVLLRMMFSQMNIMRQSLAIGLLFISLHMLLKKRIFFSILFTLLASSFHITAISFLLIIIFRNIVPTKKLCFIWIAVSALVYVVGSYLLALAFRFFPQFAHYETSQYFEGNNLANLLNMLVCLSFIFLMVIFNRYPIRKKKRSSNLRHFICDNTFSKNNIIVLMMLFSFTFYCLACRASLIDRVATYFFMSVLIFVPNYIEKYCKNKIFIYSTITSFLIMYYFVILILRPEWNQVVPYIFGG